MARIVFVIARNIANTKNPLPTGVQNFKRDEVRTEFEIINLKLD